MTIEAPRPTTRPRLRLLLQVGAGLLVLLALLAAWLLVPRYPADLEVAQIDSTAPEPRPVEPTVLERTGYYDTVWPSEHADLWRSHAVSDAGLPADFDVDRLEVTSTALNLPTWGYTRGEDEVFVIGGSPFLLDTFTQSIATGEPAAGMSQLVSDLLDPSTPYVAKINPSTMDPETLELTRGSTLNYTGGLLMHENGYVYAVSQAVLYKINPDSMEVEASVGLPLLGTTWASQYWTTYNGLQVLRSGSLVLKGFNLIDDVGVPGVLLQVDPDTLTFEVEQEATVSSARLMIDEGSNGPGHLHHVNATESLRFVISGTGFRLDEAWTRTYRDEGDGSTQASSPMLLGGLDRLVFANNTAPGATVPIQLFTQGTRQPEGEPLSPTPAFAGGSAGFNFFMVAGDPFRSGTVVYYDPINDQVSAHRLTPEGDLEPLWQRDSYKVSASPALVPDRDLLYIDDYRDGRDHLVVLRLSTGEELAVVELDATLPTIGTIFPGTADDVYLLSTETGGRPGLVNRVYVP
ncbi:MAG: hypothetical protein H7Y15_06110 [Pseudonocardia sp.]|nr:hypothetical protein [Pseudonocardia sp.]